MSDWQPTASLDALLLRHRLRSRIRRLFDDAGFIEVETPCLSSESVIDAHLDPIEVPFDSASRSYLQTSPEAHMKRLLSAGAPSIYQLTRSFRAGEIGDRHNPEFSMLEWYALGWSIEDQIKFISRLVESSIAEIGQGSSRVFSSPRLVTYSELVREATGIDALETTPMACRDVLIEKGISIPAGMDESPLDDWLNLIWSGIVEPSLVDQGMVYVTDYPASQAALARLSPSDPRVALRFELYLNGLEICNGYDELTDPDELDARMQSQQSLRTSLGKESLRAPSRLIEAQRAHFPACTGVALGFDRLMMWLIGSSQISDVISFPWGRA
ncbi:EF-P lysine aminoacylase GenX [Lacunimicrobium album]